MIENSVTRIIRPDGELRYLAGDSGVEREADGKVIAVVGILVDVTNHKLAEAEMAATRDAALEQARRAELAESIAHLGHWRLDLATDEVTWSPQMYRIYDLPDDTPLDLKVLLAMTHPDDAKAGAKRMKHQRESGASYENTITRIIRPDGTVRYLAGNTTGERNAKGDLVALIGTIVDVTEQRELESQLRHAKAEAQAAALVKSEFLANMSHELRTPLTSIIGFTNLAIAQAELSPLTRNYVGRVQDASRALLATVNDVLDFSKLEAGQASILPQPTDLTALARSSLDLFTPQAAAKDLTLTMTGETEGLVLSLDPDRVRQILLNLVSNAVKFTAVGGVTLNTAYDRDAQSLLVEVSDTGAGIPPSKIGALFKRFSQVDGSLTRSGGTGLGLAICKGLAEAMGGEIGVDSRPAGGSRFWFRIPAPEATMAAAAPGASHDQLSFSGARVLVADDHPANRELARLFLEGAGADVTEAEDGVEAAALAASLPFDAILMDMRMPRLNGPGALRRIRAAAGPNDATPILAFTADGDEDNERELMALGFQGVVRKPVSPTVLIAAVARVTAFAEPVFAEETAHGH